MKPLIGPHLHERVLELVRAAEVQLILITPYLSPWDELKAAVAEAVARKVDVRLITRGGKKKNGQRERPTRDDLEPFQKLNIDIQYLPGLHAKLYVSEREALVSSVNLTACSLDNSWECAFHVRREEAPADWADVMEMVLQTMDEVNRRAITRKEDSRTSETRAEEIVVPGLAWARVRERALAGNIEAMRSHHFCIECKESVDVEEVVCGRCYAMGVAQNRSEPLGRFCACCGEKHEATAQDPHCENCTKNVLDPAAHDDRQFYRDPAPWYVKSQDGLVEAWSSTQRGNPAERVACIYPYRWAQLGSPHEAVKNRFLFRLGRVQWINARYIADDQAVDVLSTLVSHMHGAVLNSASGVAWERRVVGSGGCVFSESPFALSVPETDRVHLSYQGAAEEPVLDYWERGPDIARWEAVPIAISGGLIDPMLLWADLVAAVDPVSAVKAEDWSKPAFGVDATLFIPTNTPGDLARKLPLLLQAMMAALYRYTGAEKHLLLPLICTKKAVEAGEIEALINKQGVLGDAPQLEFRSRSIRGTGADRVACGVIRSVEASDGRWRLSGRVYKLERVRRH